MMTPQRIGQKQTVLSNGSVPPQIHDIPHSTAVNPSTMAAIAFLRRPGLLRSAAHPKPAAASPMINVARRNSRIRARGTG